MEETRINKLFYIMLKPQKVDTWAIQATPVDKGAINVSHPFEPNGISHPYQLDQSISVFRVVGRYLIFWFLFKFQSNIL